VSSILLDVRKLIGPGEDYDEFDKDLIVHINGAFADLNRLGCGPENGFFIEDDSTTWDDYLQESVLLSYVKQYIVASVRLSFDPPSSGSVMEALNKQIDKLEWMINSLTDRGFKST
jgi:hypothetical protein